ncbi:MAG: ribosome biogenesis GTP-binding protein YihA/YsxC [Pseudomonadota bacterium]
MTDADKEAADQAIETGRKLFAGPCDFMLGVVSLETLPDGDTSEIAFAGRSNVGKSSLLNALTGRNNLARASNTPGRTRELNFFDLGGVMKLVDLPGYGYAKTSRKTAHAWTRLTRDYLRGRMALRRVCLLVDARHGLKASDLEIADLLDKSAVNYQIVLTKTDKVKPTDLEKTCAATRRAIAKRPAAHPDLMPTSSQTGAGLPELRMALAALVDA